MARFQKVLRQCRGQKALLTLTLAFGLEVSKGAGRCDAGDGSGLAWPSEMAGSFPEGVGN